MSGDHEELLRERGATWDGFMKLITVSSVVITIILILMWIFLV